MAKNFIWQTWQSSATYEFKRWERTIGNRLIFTSTDRLARPMFNRWKHVPGLNDMHKFQRSIVVGCVVHTDTFHHYIFRVHECIRMTHLKENETHYRSLSWVFVRVRVAPSLRKQTPSKFIENFVSRHFMDGNFISLAPHGRRAHDAHTRSRSDQSSDGKENVAKLYAIGCGWRFNCNWSQSSNEMKH